MTKQVFQRTPLLICGLCFCLLTVGSSALAEDRIVSDVKVTSKGKLSMKERRALSLAATRILHHVRLARADLRKKKSGEASANVQKALTLVSLIETAAPQYEVTAAIKAGKLSYEDRETARDTLTPVYAELDETSSVLAPLKRAKKEAAASENGSVTGDALLQYTTILLDVDEAKYNLESAAASLKKGETDSADKSLQAIQEDVIVEFDEIDLPLVKARGQLVDAARKLGRNEYKDAKESLKKAAAFVDAYAAQVGEGFSNRARGLADEINAFAGKVEERKDKAQESVNRFWERLVEMQ